MSVPVLEILAGSQILIGVPITVDTDLGAPVDPTADVVEFTMLQSKEVTSGAVWDPADWLRAGSDLFIVHLIGVDPFVLTAGWWWPFVRITDSPEIPELRGTPVRIT